MLEPESQIVFIATPWSASDLTATLKTNSEWTTKRYAVGTEQDIFAPLWPSRWPRDKLERQRREMGSIEFDRAYRCIALTGDTIPFRPDWIHFYTAELLGDPNKLICVQGYDLAISQASSADYFACVTVLYSPERNFYFIADCQKCRIGFAEQARLIIANAQRWAPDKIVLESVGLGGGLGDFLRTNSPFPLPVVPYRPKYDKQRRFLEITPLFEDGRVFFHPNLDPARNVLVGDRGDLIGELLEFPLGQHDDGTDAMVSALAGLYEFRTSEEPDDGWIEGGGTKARLSVVG
jgi:predicted phage terminase large subunit-like protein